MFACRGWLGFVELDPLVSSKPMSRFLELGDCMGELWKRMITWPVCGSEARGDLRGMGCSAWPARWSLRTLSFLIQMGASDDACYVDGCHHIFMSQVNVKLTRC